MKKRDLLKHIISLAILIIFGALAAGSIDTNSDIKQNTSEPPDYSQQVRSMTPAYKLSPDELYDEYKANEVAADLKFKGKVVVVNGTITNIGKDILGQAYVVMGGKGSLDGVQCVFPKSEELSIARLGKGQIIEIKGEVSGKMGNVLMNKCIIN